MVTHKVTNRSHPTVFPAHIQDQNPKETKTSTRSGKFHPFFGPEEGRQRSAWKSTCTHSHTPLHRRGIFPSLGFRNVREGGREQWKSPSPFKDRNVQPSLGGKRVREGDRFKKKKCTPIIPIFRKSQCV